MERLGGIGGLWGKRRPVSSSREYSDQLQTPFAVGTVRHERTQVSAKSTDVRFQGNSPT